MRPAPRAGAGPTVIAAALVVLVIGLGWLNHSGDAGDGTTPLARDVSQAIERTDAAGEIPGSEPATPSQIGSTPGGGNRTTSTTIVIDPETGLHITINLPAGSGATGSTDGSRSGTTGTTSGSGGTTGTTGGSGTTNPPPPSTNPPTSGTTQPPTSGTTQPPTSNTTLPPTTDPPTTLPPADPGLVGGLLDGLTGMLGL